MTLNEYINHLIYLRDKYQAGEFEVKTHKYELRETCMDLADGIWRDVTILEDETIVPMDGDDFHLDIKQKILQVDCKQTIQETTY